MAAVIRVKRRIDEEPLNAFVLNCKKRKTVHDANNEKEVNEVTDEEVSTILRFAGTVKDGNDLKGHITHLTKHEAEDAVKKIRKPHDVTSRNRQQFQKDIQNNRFKVVNCSRSIKENDQSGKNFTIVDVVKQEEQKDDAAAVRVKSNEDKIDQSDANSKETEQQSNANVPTASCSSGAATEETHNFVYDLYVTDGVEQPEFDDNLLDNLISVQPYENGIYNYRDDFYGSEDDSEDSNAEGNWKNDYPDTDDDFSIGEDDMRLAVEDLNLGSDHELSSDESEYANEPVVHFLDCDEMTEYQYFKKHGHLRANEKYYRSSKNTQRQCNTESDSDDVEPNESDSSNSGLSISDDDSDDQ